MARINVYLPDDLADDAKRAGLNISGLTQEAVRSALAAGQTTEWLESLEELRPTGITHEDVLEAVAHARNELEARG